MAAGSRFWRRTAFQASQAVCVAFVVLTAVAMVAYPGGTEADASTGAYSFFQNFFSDLGRTKAWSGEGNAVSAVLFIAALSSAGAVLALFFVAFAQFFRRSRWGRLLSWLGLAAGVLSGACFVGIAATPSDLHGWAHSTFVDWAFRAFLLAVVLYTGAILADRRYPGGMALVFALFALLLAGYVVLITVGPSSETPEGLRIQVTGQKVIVYAAIATIFIQAGGALRFAGRTTAP